MAWRDDLRTASFRGIECLYDGAGEDRGRRLAVQEYPLRDQADVQDLGRSVRRYRLDLYVLASQLGAGYTQRRDALIEALEARGAGTLVHPYYGPIEVHAETFSLRYSTREGGMCRLSCTFVEAAAAREPQRAARTDAIMRENGDRLLEQIGDDFVTDWVLDRVPEFVREGARAVLEQARAALQIKTDVFERLIGARLALASPLQDARTVFAALAYGRDVLAALGLARIRKSRGFGATLEPSRGSTPSTRTRNDNAEAVATVVEAVTLVAATDVVSRTVFESVNEALAARDEVLEQIDDLSLTASDGAFERLRGLRAALVADIRARGAGLPNVRTITPAVTEPAVVLAHRLYGDATRAADIVARNRVAHPGFVPGGQPLEVLTDAA